MLFFAGRFSLCSAEPARRQLAVWHAGRAASEISDTLQRHAVVSSTIEATAALRAESQALAFGTALQFFRVHSVAHGRAPPALLDAKKRQLLADGRFRRILFFSFRNFFLCLESLQAKFSAFYIRIHSLYHLRWGWGWVLRT